jgi:hypothetical protein
MNLQDEIKKVIARLKSFKGRPQLRAYDNEYTVKLSNGDCIKILGDFISFANLVAWELLVTDPNISDEEILDGVWDAFKEESKRLRPDRDVLSFEQPFGVNTQAHLERATTPAYTFRQRVDWCRQYHVAWTDGKPQPIRTMESQLEKHILPRFGDMPLDAVDETAVQEFAADLKRSTFEMRKPNGDLIKTYKLSRKTVLNVVGLVKSILGRKVWLSWQLDLGKPNEPTQRYFTEEELKRIIDATDEPYRTLFALLAGTGMRIGEAAGLHIDDLDLDNLAADN